MLRIHPDQAFIAPGEKHEVLDVNELKRVIEDYPSGLLILQDESRFSEQLEFVDNETLELEGFRIKIEFIGSGEPGVNIFRYQVD